MGSGIATPSYWSDATNADYTGNVSGGGYTHPPVTQPPVTQPPITQPPITQPPVTQPPTGQPPIAQPPVQNPYGGGFGQAWKNGDFSRLSRGLTNFYQNKGYLPPGIARRLPEGFDYSQIGSATGSNGAAPPIGQPVVPQAQQAPANPYMGATPAQQPAPASLWSNLNILPDYQAPPNLQSPFAPVQAPAYQPPAQQTYPTFGPYPASPQLAVSYPSAPLGSDQISKPLPGNVVDWNIPIDTRPTISPDNPWLQGTPNIYTMR